MVIINLKESFRLHNHLESVITDLTYYLNNEQNVVKVTEIHQKNKTNKEAMDETIDVVVEKRFDCKVEDILFLVKKLIEEKLKLSICIEEAKKELFLDWKENGNTLSVDCAVEFNKHIRNFAANLKRLMDLKSTETESQGSDFKFNSDGNQVSYRYPLVKKKVIDYDRNIVKEQYKKLMEKADIISTKIDQALLKDCVDYECIYNLHDSVEEIVEKYAKG